MGYDETQIKQLEAKAKVIRHRVVECIGIGVAGHLGGSCSSADLVTALYFSKLRHDPADPKKPDRDRFLLSKGHAAILQYACLAESGYFPVEDLPTTKALDSYLQGHPDARKTPGVEVSTGSLGQGLSIGLGMALGQRLDGYKSKTYVLMGDGEIAEGQIWEAAMAAAVLKADNLVAILDKNGLQAMGTVAERFDYGHVEKKWAAFGWHVIEIDGHDMAQILAAYEEADTVKGKPTVIIAKTVKGKGVSFTENVVSFHNGILSREQYEQALRELS